MSDRFVFQNARIKAMESKLLSAQTVQRLQECNSAEDAVKLLSDAGFGAGKGADGGDLDALFRAEEESAYAMLREFNADGALDAFLLNADFHNLKALIKARLAEKTEAALMPEGTVPIERLKEVVLEGKREDIPREMAEVLVSVEKLTAEGKAAPRAVDTLTDKAMFAAVADAAVRGGKLVREYFAVKTDIVNIISFVRTKRLGLPSRFFEDCFMPGGRIAEEDFMSVFDGTPDALREKLRYTEYGDIAAKAADGASLTELERDADDALYGMIAKESGDMFGAAPVINYFLYKLMAVNTVRLIAAGIRNNVEPALIKERMRGIYA